MKKNITPIAIALVSVMGMAGCEWDNSDKYMNNSNTGTGSGSNNDSSSTTKPIRGSAGTPEGSYKDAEVCADLNGNGYCDRGEPSTSTGTDGDFELNVPEDTTGDVDIIVTTKPGQTVNEDTGETVTTEESHSATVDADSDEEQTVTVPPASSGGSSDDTVDGSVMAGTGHLNIANVCIDLDNNQKCDSGEPSDTSGENRGRFSLGELPDDTNFHMLAEITENETIDESTGETETSSYTLRSPYDPDADKQVISPITDLVSTEFDKLNPPDFDVSKKSVSQRLETSSNIMGDYITNSSSDDDLVAENAERLKRISQVIEELKRRIESNITPSDKANSGLPDAEINDRVNEKIKDATSKITEDVDNSLVDNKEFSPGDIIDDPKYDSAKKKPDLTPKSSDQKKLERRIKSARLSTPYFYQDAYERKAIPGAQTIMIKLEPHPIDSGMVYYEAVQKITTKAKSDTAEISSRIAMSRPGITQNGLGLMEYLFTAPANGENWCKENPFGTTSILFDCREIDLNPETFQALTWSGSAWRKSDLHVGVSTDTLGMEGYEAGTMINSSMNGGLSTELTFHEFDLGGIKIKDVMKELFDDKAAAYLEQKLNTDELMVGNAKGWRVTEKVTTQFIASGWAEPETNLPSFFPQESITSYCEGHSEPEVNEVGSCNLNYGYKTPEYPAKTFNDLTYPANELGSVYAGNLKALSASGAIRIAGPGDADYVMRLFGEVTETNEETGAIQIDRRLPGESAWKTVSTSGQWEYSTNKLPHLNLNLPDAFNYPLAQLSFKAGRPILYELNGYVRHGWITEPKINPETLFGREPNRYRINEPALEQIHDVLTEKEVSRLHPFFWPEYRAITAM